MDDHNNQKPHWQDGPPPSYQQDVEGGRYPQYAPSGPAPAPVAATTETRTVIIDNEPRGLAHYAAYGNSYGMYRPDPVTVSITTTQPPQPGQPQYGPGGQFYTQQPQTLIVTTQGLRVGPQPTGLQCPTCKEQVISHIEHENGLLTWICVGGIAALGCFLGCCLIPLCIPSLQDVYHTCPNCKSFLGRYRRLS